MMLAVIPARANSKGISNKNIKNFFHGSLLHYAIDACENSTYIEDYVVSTDYDWKTMSNFITKEHYFKRPDWLAKDDTPMLPVLENILQSRSDVDSIILLQPTSPLRKREDIDKAIGLFMVTGADSLVSGYKMQIKQEGKVFDKRLCKNHFQRNGAIFITKRSMLEKGKIFDENSVKYVMPKSRSIDIDDEDDWKMAQALIKGGAL